MVRFSLAVALGLLAACRASGTATANVVNLPNAADGARRFRLDRGATPGDDDHDGVDDRFDACPDAPEHYNGERDDDGCPDGRRQALRFDVTTGEIEVPFTRQVELRSGDPLWRHELVFTELAFFLRAHPEFDLEIITTTTRCADARRDCADDYGWRATAEIAVHGVRRDRLHTREGLEHRDDHGRREATVRMAFRLRPRR